MEYVSAKEMAQKWGIHIRVVQRYCTVGRVPGAKKFGYYWMIPADAKKPIDPRKKQPHEHPFYTLPQHCPLLTMTSLYRTPGSGDAVAKSLADDGEAALLFSAQLAYLRGDIAGAAALARQLPDTKTRPDLDIGLAFLGSLCALYRGDAAGWLSARKSVEEMPCCGKKWVAQRDFWLGNIDLELYDISGFPDWFCGGDFEPLPENSYPLARYAYIRYVVLAGTDVRAALLLSPFLSECQTDGVFVAEIYCRIIAAVCHLECGEIPAAAKQLDRAIALSLPDRLYAPLAEYRDNLGTLLDERLSLVDKEALRMVKALNEQIREGWTALNRTLYGLINTTDLTQQERQAAKLAARGLSNADIAGRMNITVNTVKRYVSEAISKTGAGSRTELAKFLAMAPPDA